MKDIISMAVSKTQKNLEKYSLNNILVQIRLGLGWNQGEIMEKRTLICLLWSILFSIIPVRSLSTYSKTRKKELKSLAWTTQWSLTIFTWLNLISNLISRIAVIGKPSLSRSSRTFFNATIASVSRHWPRKTCPKVPSPIIASRLKNYWSLHL